MAINEAYFGAGSQVLYPAYPSPFNRTIDAGFGASLTIPKGMALGKKTSDNRCYPLNKLAADGTQNFVGFNGYSLQTDGSGNIYYTWGSTPAEGTFFTIGPCNSLVWTGGIFRPEDVLTAATGTPVAEVDTFTPATVTTTDINIITLPSGAQISFTIGGTATAAAAVTGLKAAWAANAEAVALGTTSGTGTLIITAATPGVALGLASSVIGTGTLTKAVTTPASYAAQSEVDTFTPTTVTTGDVNTITINYPNALTSSISFTVGATATATAAANGLRAAWNASPAAAQYGTASGTATFVVTGQVGSAMNLTSSVVGTGTLPKSVTTIAYGQNIADIQLSRAAAYVLENGYWSIP